MTDHNEKTVLVVAAHPDDEVLGCGATIAAHAAAGDKVHVVILAEGITSRKDSYSRDADNDDLHRLSKAAHDANEFLGVDLLHLHELPDNRMDTIPLLEVTKLVEHYINTLSPEIVYTHHGGDVNVDHQITHKAVVTACRPLPGQPVKRLLFFEVPSSTEWQVPHLGQAFLPNWFVDVTTTLPLKLQALGCYQSEMRQWPHARSFQAVENLARWRGASSGVAAAEAFMLGRYLCT